MIVFEILPIALSIVLLVSMKIRKSYWESKIVRQMSKFANMDKEDNKFIISIVEDVGVSTSFVGAIFAILFAVILIFIKECVVNGTIDFSSVEFICLIILIVIYSAILIRLFTMKDVLLCKPCSFCLFRNLNYIQLFTYCLYLGYASLIAMLAFR